MRCQAPQNTGTVRIDPMAGNRTLVIMKEASDRDPRPVPVARLRLETTDVKLAADAWQGS